MKKFVSILLAAMMLFSMFSFASAENTLAGTYDIVIWAPQEAKELTEKQVADFNASNTDGIVINVTVEPVSEADAATNMITDT